MRWLTVAKKANRLHWLPRQLTLSRCVAMQRRNLVIALPWLWLLLFFLLPFLLILKISFAETAFSIPPYSVLVTWRDQTFTLVLNFANYLLLLSDKLYLSACLQSVTVAAMATLLCLLIGYPLAWAIVQSQPATRSLLLLLVMLPSWTSFLVRIYAWMGLLNENGVLNQALLWLGIIDQPLTLLYTNSAVYLGLVYCYLPLMVLPIYTALVRLDYSLIEAALDLGARPLTTFFRIILPLTKGGVTAGAMLVFIPAFGEFVIPELLGGPDNIMIGRILWQEFFNNHDWPVASSLAIAILLMLSLPIIWFYKLQNSALEKKK